MDCVEVCPVDCFYEGENMLVIHPDECIDCGVCEPECPVDAIKADSEPGLEKWLSLNAEWRFFDRNIWPDSCVTRAGIWREVATLVDDVQLTVLSAGRSGELVELLQVSSPRSDIGVCPASPPTP